MIYMTSYIGGAIGDILATLDDLIPLLEAFRELVGSIGALIIGFVVVFVLIVGSLIAITRFIVPGVLNKVTGSVRITHRD